MFTKDNRTETFLNQMGVEFRYTNAIKFSDCLLYTSPSPRD